MREALEAQLEAVGQGCECRKALHKGLIEALAATTRVGTARHKRGVGGVDEERAVLFVARIAPGEGNAAVRIQDLEVLSVEAHGDITHGQRRRHCVAGAADGERGVLVDTAGSQLEDTESRAGKADEQLAFLGEGLVGDAAGGAVDTQVADARCLVEPGASCSLQVLPGVEVLGFQEVVPDQPEGLLLLALAVGVPHLARKWLNAIVTGEVEKPGIPEHLPRREATDDGCGHVVEHQAQRAAAEVLEARGEPLEQSRLPLVAKEAEKQLARVRQQTAEGAHLHRLAADAQDVRRPVYLQLLSRSGLEAALHLLAWLEGELAAQLARVLRENGAAAHIAQLAKLPQGTGHRDTQFDAALYLFEKALQLVGLLGLWLLAALLRHHPRHDLAAPADSLGDLARAVVLAQTHYLRSTLRGQLSLSPSLRDFLRLVPWLLLGHGQSPSSMRTPHWWPRAA